MVDKNILLEFNKQIQDFGEEIRIKCNLKKGNDLLEIRDYVTEISLEKSKSLKDQEKTNFNERKGTLIYLFHCEIYDDIFFNITVDFNGHEISLDNIAYLNSSDSTSVKYNMEKDISFSYNLNMALYIFKKVIFNLINYVESIYYVESDDFKKMIKRDMALENVLG